MEFLDGDLLDARGDRPLVAKRINHSGHSIALNSAGWFLDGSCASIYGAPVNKIDIGHVNIECAASWLTPFEGPHHRNDRVAMRIVI